MVLLFSSSPLSILSFIPLFHGKETTAYVIAGLTGLLTLLRLVFAFAGRYNRRLPPGPDRLPLLGNLHNFPQSGWLDAFCSWQERFGEVLRNLRIFSFRSSKNARF
jgi:hypothetical protein